MTKSQRVCEACGFSPCDCYEREIRLAQRIGERVSRERSVSDWDVLRERVRIWYEEEA
jgi:hypothetical protein